MPTARSEMNSNSKPWQRSKGWCRYHSRHGAHPISNARGLTREAFLPLVAPQGLRTPLHCTGWRPKLSVSHRATTKQWRRKTCRDAGAQQSPAQPSHLRWQQQAHRGVDRKAANKSDFHSIGRECNSRVNVHYQPLCRASFHRHAIEHANCAVGLGGDIEETLAVGREAQAPAEGRIRRQQLPPFV